MIFHLPRLLLIPLFLLVLALNGRACNVPVYRYALEYWPASPFRVTVFHRGPLTPAQQEALDWLPKESKEQRRRPAPVAQSGSAIPLNIMVHDVDLEAPDPVGAGLWSIQGNPELPWVVVEFPFEDHIPVPAWTGKLEAESMKSLADSPVRHDLARRLLRGDSSVWILVQKNDTTAAQIIGTVEAELRKLETTLKLPPPEKGMESENPPTTLKTPLKVGFSTIHVREDDPAEKIFLQILLRTSRTPVAADASVVAYPVFGRGRCLGGHAGNDLKPEAIEKECAFLIGACSCQIKAQNPGADLPMLVKWEDFIAGTVPVSKALPSLTSLKPLTLPQATAVETKPVVSASEKIDSAPAPQSVKQVQAPAPAARQAIRLSQSVFAVLGAAIVLVFGVALILRGKRR